jgi:hypothetical protein
MFGKINKIQKKSDVRPTLAPGFKFSGVITTTKGVIRSISNNDSGIHQGSGESGNITGQNGSTSGNDGVGKTLHG